MSSREGPTNGFKMLNMIEPMQGTTSLAGNSSKIKTVNASSKSITDHSKVALKVGAWEGSCSLNVPLMTST